MAPIYFIIIAFPCTVGAIALALFHIYRHLFNYTEPTFQRFIVRIIFMVPLHEKPQFSPKNLKKPLDGFKHTHTMKGGIGRKKVHFRGTCHFSCLFGGAKGRAVVLSLSGRVLKPSWYLMTCCFPPMPLDGRFIRRCKQGALQFVILKPILVALTFVLYAKGKYEDGNFSAKQAYLYVTIIYTISYTMALYALALFYVACRDLLQPFNPVPKFIMIKSVVFLTYWQGVLVFLAAKSGLIKNAEEAAEVQNFVVCVEMLLAAVAHLYAFPYKEYAGANIGASGGFTGSLAHALAFNDFYHDTVHQFAPTYHDYVLYNHNEGDEGMRKYRSRTFVPTGQEMDNVRRNKLTFGNKVDDLQLSSLSSSPTSTPKNTGTSHGSAGPEAMNSSLLRNSSNSVSQSYDFSFVDMDLSSYPTKVPSASRHGN
ncbi:hypothetical protein Syun_028556 [Stephania yunnanensis]|uniref:Transmembrane protein 184B n=1 Tax=Stephania yunnanensis TaxID=152371 RepID=A0AAP0E8B3_9MAGN